MDSPFPALAAAFEAVASTPIDSVELPPWECHGPLLEDSLASPLQRFKKVCEDAGITPGILRVAEHIAGMEVEARHNIRIGDALFAEEAKELMSEVKSELHERKKKRVHADAAEAVAALEKKWLAKQAREARKKMKRALSDPTRLTKCVRDRFGNRI